MAALYFGRWNQSIFLEMPMATGCHWNFTAGLPRDAESEIEGGRPVAGVEC